jgi:hypothetical protein
MMTESNPTTELAALIRQKGRWPSISQPLLAALEAEVWRQEGFPSPTAWLDRLAALGARSTTYLSRGVSATRFVNELQTANPSLDLSRVWDRPLSAIEAFRRQTGGDADQILARLPELLSGALTSYRARRDDAQQMTAPGKAERQSFPDTVMKALPQILPDMGYPTDTRILLEPRTPVGRPNIVLIDPETGSVSIIEIKSNLSHRMLEGMVQQLLAYSSLGQRIWLALPSDSEVPGEAIINHLRSVATLHVGLLLLDPATSKIVQLIAPQAEAPDSETRSAFKNLVLSSERKEA